MSRNGNQVVVIFRASIACYVLLHRNLILLINVGVEPQLAAFHKGKGGLGRTFKRDAVGIGDDVVAQSIRNDHIVTNDDILQWVAIE